MFPGQPGEGLHVKGAVVLSFGEGHHEDVAAPLLSVGPPVRGAGSRAPLG